MSVIAEIERKNYEEAEVKPEEYGKEIGIPKEKDTLEEQCYPDIKAMLAKLTSRNNKQELLELALKKTVSFKKIGGFDNCKLAPREIWNITEKSLCGY